MQEEEVDINQIFNNLAVEKLTLSTFIVGNEKFNNYYTDKNYYDEPTSSNNILGFNLNNNTDTNYINLIIPSKPSSSPTTNYFLRIENINQLEKEKRVQAIKTFNEIYNFVETLKPSVPVPEINIVEYAYSDDATTVNRSLKKLFCTQNNTQTGVRYPLRDINLDTKYDKNCLIDNNIKQIITKFGESLLNPNTKNQSTSLFIAKTKYISDAVTFHDKIEEINYISNPRELQNQAMQNQAMQNQAIENFLMAQTNLLYFYILLNNEKQIVSFDSHYNNIMILPDYKVALIDFKQYYKTSEIINDIINNKTKNSSFQHANTIFVQYLRNKRIYNMLFDDEEQPGKRRKIDNDTTEQIKIKRKIKNDIICLLFAEYYAYHKTCSLSFCTSILDLHLINLLKGPFNSNDNFTDNILILLINLYITPNNSYVECNSKILTYIMEARTPRGGRGARGGKNVRSRKKKHSKKRTKKRTKKQKNHTKS